MVNKNIFYSRSGIFFRRTGMSEEKKGEEKPTIDVLEEYDESLDLLFEARGSDNQDVIYKDFLKFRKYIQEYQKLSES